MLRTGQSQTDNDNNNSEAVARLRRLLGKEMFRGTWLLTQGSPRGTKTCVSYARDERWWWTGKESEAVPIRRQT